MEGVNGLADAVACTMGPRGKLVAIKLGLHDPKFTKDGVTVARNVFFPDPFKNLGSETIAAAALRTGARCGDGTTTATVLARALLVDGRPIVQSDVDVVITNLRAQALPVQRKADKRNVALVSANNDAEVADMVADTLEGIGLDGQVTVELSSAVKPDDDSPGWYGKYLRSEIVAGMSIPKGYASPYFVTNTEKMTAELINPKILVVDKYVHNWEQIVEDLGKVAKEGNPLLLIAREVGGDALHALVLNKVKNGVKVAAVSSGSLSSDVIDDLVIATGASLTERKFGSAKKVIIHHDKTVIVEGGGDASEIENRCAMLRDTGKKERLANLTGGVAVLWVGGATEAEASERRDRVDDALGATRSAVEEGIVPGGGFALFHAGRLLPLGVVKAATEMPARQILRNAGLDADEILSVCANRPDTLDGISVSEPKGYDARNEKYVDMLKAGIIDPVKVVCSAFGDAVSVARLVLNTECAIVEKVEEKK